MHNNTAQSQHCKIQRQRDSHRKKLLVNSTTIQTTILLRTWQSGLEGRWDAANGHRPNKISNQLTNIPDKTNRTGIAFVSIIRQARRPKALKLRCLTLSNNYQ